MKQLLNNISDIHIQIRATVIVYILHLLEWWCKDNVMCRGSFWVEQQSETRCEGDCIVCFECLEL